MTYELRATEYLYRGHWIRLYDSMWFIRDERAGAILWYSESIDECTRIIDEVMDEWTVDK